MYFTYYIILKYKKPNTLVLRMSTRCYFYNDLDIINYNHYQSDFNNNYISTTTIYYLQQFYVQHSFPFFIPRNLTHNIIINYNHFIRSNFSKIVIILNVNVFSL